jgi:hypothetical protein
MERDLAAMTKAKSEHPAEASLRNYRAGGAINLLGAAATLLLALVCLIEHP